MPTNPEARAQGAVNRYPDTLKVAGASCLSLNAWGGDPQWDIVREEALLNTPSQLGVLACEPVVYPNLARTAAL